MKNEVWEIVLRPKNKDVVSSRWLFKIKHASDGIIEKNKKYLSLMDFPRRKELTMKRHSLL
jgi:hypothetical protein